MPEEPKHRGKLKRIAEPVMRLAGKQLAGHGATRTRRDLTWWHLTSRLNLHVRAFFKTTHLGLIDKLFQHWIPPARDWWKRHRKRQSLNLPRLTAGCDRTRVENAFPRSRDPILLPHWRASLGLRILSLAKVAKLASGNGGFQPPGSRATASARAFCMETVRLDILGG